MLVFCIAPTSRTGGLASGLPGTLGIDIYFNDGKSSFVSMLIKSKSKDILEYSDILTEEQLLHLINRSSSVVLGINFVFCSKDLLVVVLLLFILLLTFSFASSFTLYL